MTYLCLFKFKFYLCVFIYVYMPPTLVVLPAEATKMDQIPCSQIIRGFDLPEIGGRD